MTDAIRETPHGLALSVSLNLRGGLHSRPAARLARVARQYAAEIRCLSENGEADAKSMLDLLSLAPGVNATLTFLATGEDARAALLDIGGALADMQE